MKRLSNIFIAAAVGFMLTGCGLYDKYEQKVDAPADAFGTSLISDASTEGASLAQTSWREFFSDPLLQQLIEQVLANNTDLNTARIAVEKSEASLKMAKLAYLPSLYFAPQGATAMSTPSARHCSTSTNLGASSPARVPTSSHRASSMSAWATCPTFASPVLHSTTPRLVA